MEDELSRLQLCSLVSLVWQLLWSVTVVFSLNWYHWCRYCMLFCCNHLLHRISLSSHVRTMPVWNKIVWNEWNISNVCIIISNKMSYTKLPFSQCRVDWWQMGDKENGILQKHVIYLHSYKTRGTELYLLLLGEFNLLLDWIILQPPGKGQGDYTIKSFLVELSELRRCDSTNML